MHNPMTSVDYSRSPFLVIWETTRACDLSCIHCRASAEPQPKPDELSPKEGIRFVEQVSEAGAPILVFSGGDPLKRPDLTDLIAHASSLGLRTGTIPAVTPLVTRAKLRELKKAGLDQIAFSLDAANPDEHDRFRRTEGVFSRTLEVLRIAREEGLAVQINSLVNLHNEEDLDVLIALVENLAPVFWEVFFLVPTGRGAEIPLMTADLFETAFRKIYELQSRVSFVIKITEAPHYRRYYMERKKLGGSNSLPPELRRKSGPGMTIGHAPSSVNAGKGFVFVSYRGDVFPSGFLPLSAGNILYRSLSDIYQKSPLFQDLRNPRLLKGRCGVCSYNEVCGGSRSRAYALTGDYLAEDPCCAYIPHNFNLSVRETVSL